MKTFKTLAAFALLAPMSALAMPIQVDFTITATSFMSSSGVSTPGGSYAGFPTGTVGGGFFTFDDSIGQGSDLVNGLPTLDLEFSWLGQTFTEADATLWVVTFDPAGELTSWGLGRRGIPECPLNCSSSIGATDFSFLGLHPPFATGGESGFMHVDGADGLMFGNIDWTTGPVDVPEPATLGLFCLGLLGVAARRKRPA